LNRTKQI